MIDRCSEPNFYAGRYRFCQKTVPNVYEVEGYTLGVVVDLERPPGVVEEVSKHLLIIDRVY